MDIEKLNIIRKEILSISLDDKPKSDEFCGVILHSNSPFKLSEYAAAFHSFLVCSSYCYPVYFFISNDAINEEFLSFISCHSNIHVIAIERLSDIFQYNSFVLEKLFYLLPNKSENLLMFQNDGFLISPEWEDYCSNYDYLGAPWRKSVKIDEDIFYLENTYVGNGGFSFRKKSKMIQVLEKLERYGGRNKIIKGLYLDDKRVVTEGKYVVEDAIFSYFGFGLGIFKPVTINESQRFSVEPIKLESFYKRENYGFHKIDE
jgi:hypothetical protein